MTVNPDITQIFAAITATIEGALYQGRASKFSSCLAPPDDPALLRKVAELRLMLTKRLMGADEAELEGFGTQPKLLHVYWLGAGGFWTSPLHPVEAQLVEQAQATIKEGWQHPLAWRMFCILRLYRQAYQVGFQPIGLEQLSAARILQYLTWCGLIHEFVDRDDDRLYAKHARAWLTWCAERLEAIPDDDAGAARHIRQGILHSLSGLSLSSLAHCRGSHVPFIKARARLLRQIDAIFTKEEHRVASIKPRFPDYIPPERANAKLRIGYIVPTLDRGPDTVAVMNEICNFPDDACEIYLFSEDLHDRTCRHDVEFYRKLFGKITEARNLSNRTLQEITDVIRAEQLDVLVWSTSRHFGFGMYDRLQCRRLATLQLAMGRIQLFPVGLDSFDYFVAAKIPQNRRDAIMRECPVEDIVEMEPLQLYDWPETVAPVQKISRADLGLAPQDVMLYCGAAIDKLIPDVIEAYVEILSRLPQGKLVLSPLNPGWSGMICLPVLRERLRRSCVRQGVAEGRIVIVNELEPTDTHQLMDMADLYLTQWPYAGQTMLSIALWHGCPSIVLERDLITANSDPAMVRGAGLEELVAPDRAEYIDLAVALGNDAERRRNLRQSMLAMRRQMPHNNPGRFSQTFFANVAELHRRRRQELDAGAALARVAGA